MAQFVKQGLGRNAIARELGVEFNHAQTALATRARQIDLEEARLLQAQMMAAVAHDLLESTRRP